MTTNQLSQRDRAARWVSYGQNWKTGTGRQYLPTFDHCDVIGQQSNQIRWKRKIMAITQFKVIQGHRGTWVSMESP